MQRLLVREAMSRTLSRVVAPHQRYRAGSDTHIEVCGNLDTRGVSEMHRGLGKKPLQSSSAETRPRQAGQVPGCRPVRPQTLACVGHRPGRGSVSRGPASAGPVVAPADACRAWAGPCSGVASRDQPGEPVAGGCRDRGGGGVAVDRARPVRTAPSVARPRPGGGAADRAQRPETRCV